MKMKNDALATSWNKRLFFKYFILVDVYFISSNDITLINKKLFNKKCSLLNRTEEIYTVISYWINASTMQKKKQLTFFFLNVLVHHFDSPNTLNIYDIFIYNIWYALDSWVHSESQYICIYVRNM